MSHWKAIGELRLCERFPLISSSHIKDGIKTHHQFLWFEKIFRFLIIMIEEGKLKDMSANERNDDIGIL